MNGASWKLLGVPFLNRFMSSEGKLTLMEPLILPFGPRYELTVLRSMMRMGCFVALILWSSCSDEMGIGWSERESSGEGVVVSLIDLRLMSLMLMEFLLFEDEGSLSELERVS